MKYFLTAFAFLIITYSYGQSSIGIKIYQNSDFFESNYYDSKKDESTQDKNANFNRFSLAFHFTGKKALAHEIEIFVPEILKSTYKVQFPLDYKFKKSSSLENFISSFSIRYELNKVLFNPAKRFVLSLGAGVNPYFIKTEYKPIDTNYFYSTSKLYGVSVNIIPRLNFKLTNRFALDLNIPFKIYDLKEEKYRVYNPAYPINQQTITKFKHSFFERAYTIRFGLMFKL